MLPIVVYLVVIYLANNPIARALVLRGGSAHLDIDAVVLPEGAHHLNAGLRWSSRPGSRPAWSRSTSPITPCPSCSAIPSRASGTCWGNSSLCSRASPSSPGSHASCSSLTRVTRRRSRGLAPISALRSACLPGPLSGSRFSPSSAWPFRRGSNGEWWQPAASSQWCFVPAGVGGIVSAILRTKWGFLLNLPVMMTQLWQRLLGVPDAIRFGRDAFPTTAIAAVLVFICFICMFMLNARIRAREVVRG